MFLSENSLYKTTAEYSTLITDKQRVANLFYLNLLGFLGLLKINDKAGAMVSYIAQEKKLRPNTIGDDNNDMSLVVKLALDAGIIRRTVATQITKLLVLIKTKKVRGADLNESQIRDIIRDCRIQTNRPAQRIYNAVMEFVDGKATLQQTAAVLHRISKLPDFQESSGELRDLITRGGYIGSLLKLSAPAATSTPNQPPTGSAASQTRSGRTLASSMPPPGAQTGSDADYEAAITHMFKIGSVGPGYLKRFGFVPTFDTDRFKKTVQKPEFVFPDNARYPDLTQHPFTRWVRRREQDAYDVLIKAIRDKKDGTPTISSSDSVVVDAKKSAPKPSVVIPISKEPVLTAEAAQEMNDQETAAQLNAVFKKYAWTVDMLKDYNTRAQVSALVNGVYNKQYIDAADGSSNGELINSTPFLRWYVRHTGNRTLTQKFNAYSTLVRTFEYVAKSGDLDKWLQMWTKYYVVMEEGPTRGGSRSNLMNSLPYVRSGVSQLGLTKQRVLQLLKNERKKVHDGLVNYFAQILFERGSLERALVSALSNVSSNRFSLYDVGAALTTRFGRTRVFTRGGGVDFDQEILNEITNFEFDLIELVTDAYKDKAFNLTAVDLKSAGARLLVIKDIITKAKYTTPSTGEKQTIQHWVHHTVPEEAPELTSSLRDTWMALNKMDLVDEEWIWRYVASRKDADLPQWNRPRGFYKFLTWFIETDRYKKATKETVDSIVIKSINSAWDKMFDAKLIKLTLGKNDPFLTNALTGVESQININEMLEALDYQLVPLLYKFAEPRGLRVFQQFVRGGNLEAAAEFLRHLKKTVSIDDLFRNHHSKPSTALALGPWNVVSFLRSAWFFTPEDTEYTEAFDFIKENQAPPPLRGTEPSFLRFLKVYNPEMFAVIEFKTRHLAKTDIEYAMVNAQISPGEESEQVFVDVLKSVRGLTSEQWEDDKYLIVLDRVQEMPINVKKNVLKYYTKWMDTLKVGSVNKQRIDAINENICDILLDVHAVDSRFANDIFADARVSTRNMLIKKSGEVHYLNLIKDELYKYPIKPLMQLDESRIKQVLKFNNLSINIPKTRKNIKTIEDVSKSVEKGVSDVGELKIVETNLTEEDHDRFSLDIHALSNDRHGDFCMRVLKTYDVDFPGSKERIEAFKQQHPGTQVLPRVFHGTGTVAASMILRNGFVIIPSNDSSAVGRALGNGIYFSNVSNKAAQYVSDGGYGRRYGTKGYLFEMEAALGQPRTHHRSAGFRGSTEESRFSFASPEWAVFDPKNQLRIYRVHFVELMPMSYIEELKKKYEMNESTMNFRNFLNERVDDMESSVSTFMFMDGTLPKDKETVLDFNDYRTPRNVRLTPTSDGILAEVFHSPDIDPVYCKIPNTLNWLLSEEEQVNAFFDLIQ